MDSVFEIIIIPDVDVKRITLTPLLRFLLTESEEVSARRLRAGLPLVEELEPLDNW